MTPPETSPLPVVQILAEAARLHWRHVLIFLAAALLYAVPVTMVMMPVADTLVAIQAQQTPELTAQFASQGALAFVVIPLLSAVLFWFWGRLTLMGARAGWRNDDAGRSLLAMLKVAGLMVGCVVIAAIGITPATLLLSLLGTSAITGFLSFVLVVFALSFTFAVLSRRLVETALELPRSETPYPVVTLEQHLRLAALFTAATFGMLLIQTTFNMVLTGLGATLSAKVTTGILSTATITVYASIHAIVYRMRTLPPRG